jgi:hypothetical protein
VTEKEWLTAREPDDLLEFLRERASDRQFRLFICACCRRFLPLMPKKPQHDLNLCEKYIAYGEKFAEGLITWPKLQSPFNEMEPVIVSHDGYLAAYAARMATDRDIAGSTRPMLRGRNLIAHPASTGAQYSRTVVGRLLATSKTSKGSTPTAKKRMATIAEKRYQIEILHDIFGNPFQPITFDPSWQTSTVISLALQVYDSRDFSLMPILADALQDADCDNQDVLNHCRGPGPHVRGCWVIDRLRAKS